MTRKVARLRLISRRAAGLALMAPRAGSGSRQTAVIANSTMPAGARRLGKGDMTLFHCDVRFVDPIYGQKTRCMGRIR